MSSTGYAAWRRHKDSDIAEEACLTVKASHWGSDGQDQLLSLFKDASRLEYRAMLSANH